MVRTLEAFSFFKDDFRDTWGGENLEVFSVTAPQKQTRVCGEFYEAVFLWRICYTKLNVVLWFRVSFVCVFSRKSALCEREQEPRTLSCVCSISCLLVWVGGRFRVTAPHILLSATLMTKKLCSWSYTLTRPLSPTLTAEIRSHVNPRKICIRGSDLNGLGTMAIGSGILVRPHCHPGRHLSLSPIRTRST